MTTTTTSRPVWASPDTAVLADLDTIGPVVARGDRLYAALSGLLAVSGVRTIADLERGAADHAVLADYLDGLHENAYDDNDEPVALDGEQAIREALIEHYIDVLPLPWVHSGPTGWELDELIAHHATVSGASPGGNADWITFHLPLTTLAARLRDHGYRTVAVPARVFTQFLDVPVDALHLDDGDELTVPQERDDAQA